VILADVNGDGTLDIVAAVRGFPLLFRGNGDGTFQAPTPITFTVAGANPFAAKLADLNGDGKLDLVAFETTRVLVQLGRGDGTFGTTTVLPISSSLIDTSQSNFDRAWRLCSVGFPFGHTWHPRRRLR
jgi:hypothetical protein